MTIDLVQTRSKLILADLLLIEEDPDLIGPLIRSDLPDAFEPAERFPYGVFAAAAMNLLHTVLEADPGSYFRIAGPLLKPVLQRHFDADHATLKALLEAQVSARAHNRVRHAWGKFASLGRGQRAPGLGPV